jgi:hypothetical protein
MRRIFRLGGRARARAGVDLAVAKPKLSQFWQAFTPKLVIVWREGQIKKYWRNDALAGLTVAIVALPLAMALGIAS